MMGKDQSSGVEQLGSGFIPSNSRETASVAAASKVYRYSISLEYRFISTLCWEIGIEGAGILHFW